MKLKDWAKQAGVSYLTAYKLFKSGNFPCPVTQLSTGTIIVYPEVVDNLNNKDVVLYARVSSRDQKEDLNRQLQRLKDYSASCGFKVVKEIIEIGSGLNGSRKQLLSILKNKEFKTIIVENKDRLVRFGFEYINSALEATGRKIIVINSLENKNDLVQDFIDVVTSMCSRIYGKRSAKNKAKRALKVINEDN